MRRKLFSVTIADCRVDTFTVGGNGGGGKDTSNNGVRITHPPSGAVGKCVDTRSMGKNREIAFRRMAESKEFRLWVKLKASELATGKTVEERVEEELQAEKLRVEYRTSKGWEVVE